MIEIRVNQSHKNETWIQFTLFEHVVHSETYPKYKEGDYRLDHAITDAKWRFSRRLAGALKAFDMEKV